MTPAQVQAARLIYDGPRNPRTGRLIYPGPERGSESGSTFGWAFLQGLSLTLPSTEPQFDALYLPGLRPGLGLAGLRLRPRHGPGG